MSTNNYFKVRIGLVVAKIKRCIFLPHSVEYNVGPTSKEMIAEKKYYDLLI